MRNQLAVILVAVAGLISTACQSFPTTSTDLGQVAQGSGLTNVTTGDGNFDNYKAVYHGKTNDIGIALGFGVIKIMELFPARGPEGPLTDLAAKAKNEYGATAMINVKPEERRYLFEEVAGITKYKAKRKEAERKLDQTRQNLSFSPYTL